MLTHVIAFSLIAWLILPRHLTAVLAFFALCLSGSPRVVIFGSAGVFAVLWPALFFDLGSLSVSLSFLLHWEHSPSSSRPRAFSLPSGDAAPHRTDPALSAVAPVLPSLTDGLSCAVTPVCGGVEPSVPTTVVLSSDGAVPGLVAPTSSTGEFASLSPSSGGATCAVVPPSAPSLGDTAVLDSILPTSGGAELEALELPPDFPAAPIIGDGDALLEGLFDFGGDVPPLPETPEEFGDAAPAIDNGGLDTLAALLDDVAPSTDDNGSIAPSSGGVMASVSAPLPSSNGTIGPEDAPADTFSGGTVLSIFGDDFFSAWSAFGLPQDTVVALGLVVESLGMAPPMPILPDDMTVDGLRAPLFPLEGVITPAPVVGGSVVVAGAGAPFVGFGPLDMVNEDIIMGNVEEDNRAHVDWDDPMGIQGDVAMVYDRGTWRRRATHVHGGLMARPLGVPARRYAGPYVRRYKGSPSW